MGVLGGGVVRRRHVFDSVTGTWVELAGFEGAASMFTLDVESGLDLVELDWASATITQAWDVTVADQHNYLVAAGVSSPAVLVHNTDSGLFCGVRVDSFGEAIIGDPCG